MLAPVRTAAPAQKVVSLQSAKHHLRVGFDDDDSVIQTHIDAAIDHIDGWSGILGRALVTQTWRQDFDRFSSCDPMRLPLVPVLTPPTVKYFDVGNAEQTLAATAWQVVTDVIGPFIALKSGQSWPATYPRADAVGISFDAGYGSAEDVPDALRLAILIHVKMNYDPDSRAALDPMFRSLVDRFIRFNL